ncbi:UNVERIFIED_CONTAM: hypothetical protein GTU68_018342 [Idotea baltica]|nr:hypothetical protein [Idotea baltica]
MSFSLRWYAMGYIVGIVIGWWIANNDTPPLTREQIEDLLTWVIIGVIAGGRFGYVLFYGQGQFANDPLQILRIWDGGMSFHGGFLGVCVAVISCARRYGAALGDVANILALTATPAIFLVRIANFINAELWGRPTDLPWGVIFPEGLCARHPSQLYEALLEGLILGAIILFLAFKRGWLKRKWSLVAVFLIGYGAARFAVEFVRQPDQQFTSPTWGLTQGQALSIPMIVAGVIVIVLTRRNA